MEEFKLTGCNFSGVRFLLELDAYSMSQESPQEFEEYIASDLFTSLLDEPTELN